MNLSAYDIMIDINYRKSWIDPQFMKLYSYELPKHKYYSFLTRYNKDCNAEELYLLLYDEEQEIIKNYQVVEKYNVTKYRLVDVWKHFDSLFHDKQNVNLILEETQEDCVIYKFNI